MRPWVRLLPLVLASWTVPVAAQEGDAPAYARDVRPILAEHCFPCHGPDERSRRPRSEPLRLDQRDAAVAGREAGGAIVPGDPDASVLMHRVLSEDRRERMPPGSREPLTADQIDTLRRWIQSGADFEQHWSFSPPVRSAVPVVAEPRRVANDVDRYVVATLEPGQSLSPPADRRELLRRLSFDLRGLPPSAEEVDAFLADPRADAYERRVEEYLRSDAHAERMTMWWLDLVRFADTTGIHGDNTWHIYPYRDWVLNAFRDNMPFDRFTREQLAGDLLDSPTQDQKVAAAYNRLNMITREGGSQPKEFLIRYTADRVRNASEVWLGLTVGCAECHDHKYDPITAKEFYEFGAFFADIEQVGVYAEGSEEHFKPEMSVPDSAQTVQQDELSARIAGLEARYAADSPEMDADRERWLADRRQREQRWALARPETLVSEGGATLTVLEDGSIRASGENPGVDTYRLEFQLAAPAAAVRLELMEDPAFPQQGPGRAGNGNLVVSEFEWLSNGAARSIVRATASREQGNYPIAHAIDGKAGRPGWALLGDGGARAAFGVFTLAPTAELSPAPADPPSSPDARPGAGSGSVQVLTITGPTEMSLASKERATLILRQEHGGQHTLGRFRVWVTGDAPTAEDRPLPPTFVDVLRGERPATDAERERIDALHRETTPRLAEVRDHLRRERDALKDLEDAIPLVLATVPVEPMEMRVRPRGNWMDDSGELVEPGVPAVLGGLDVEGRATRRDLADWLFRDDHPLTSRVVVNRLWKLFLGRGLVASLDDLGRQGSLPTHPGLLDHLALELVDHGFDLRHVIRQIVMSKTYRQSSRATAEALQRDPWNERLMRQARHRVDAEFVRDTALSVSGLLRPRFGGPSVRPYQPAGYYAHLNFPVRKYEASDGDDQYRRSLYTHWQRQYVHPSLLVFDAPSRERCTAERPVSNTPLAALVLLNDPIYVEAARTLATRLIREGIDDDALRIATAFRHVLQRPPLRHEMQAMHDLLDRHRLQYRADPEAAGALLEVGQSPVPADVDASELAAWTSVVRVLLNLHETITRS